MIIFFITEAKESLSQVIINMRETLADPDKVQGRLARDDKVSTVAIFTVKYV